MPPPATFFRSTVLLSWARIEPEEPITRRSSRAITLSATSRAMYRSPCFVDRPETTGFSFPLGPIVDSASISASCRTIVRKREPSGRRSSNSRRCGSSDMQRRTALAEIENIGGVRGPSAGRAGTAVTLTAKDVYGRFNPAQGLNYLFGRRIPLRRGTFKKIRKCSRMADRQGMTTPLPELDREGLNARGPVPAARARHIGVRPTGATRWIQMDTPRTKDPQPQGSVFVHSMHNRRRLGRRILPVSTTRMVVDHDSSDGRFQYTASFYALTSSTSKASCNSRFGSRAGLIATSSATISRTMFRCV